MIVVDSSALLAILLREPEQRAFEEIIAGSDHCVISAVNAHETATVLRLRHGAAAVARFWQWLAESQIEIVPFDEAQVHTRWRKDWTRRCFSKAMTSRRPT
jgi:ribonuclease VapC